MSNKPDQNDAATAGADSPHARAMQHGLPWVDPERAVFFILKRMCEDFWRTTQDEDLRTRIEDGYRGLVGAPIGNFACSTTTFSSLYLQGPPGHGKSSVVLDAARRFARMVGMNFHEDVPEGARLSKNDFVVVTREMTGEQSTLATRGIFDKVDYNGRPVTSRVPYMEFEAARDAGLAVLLFDDITSALEPVKTSMLGLIRRRHSEGQDYRNMFVVLTGNLGDADGTWTTNDGSALSGRTEKYYVEDTVKGFQTRLANQYSDDLGDGLVGSYIGDNPDDFSPPVSAEYQNQPWPSPRTWEEVARNMRSILNAYRTNPEAPIFKQHYASGGGLIETIKLAASPVGLKMSSRFGAYAESMLSRTYPLAKAIFDKGIDGAKEAFETVCQRAGNGTRNTGENNETAFQQQFAEACALITGTRIAQRPELGRKASAETIAKVLAEEISTYFKILNAPFLHTEQRCFIPIAIQTRATWGLGRRLAAMPVLQSPRTPNDAILSRNSLDLNIARLASIEVASSVNEYAKSITGQTILGADAVSSCIYGPLTGDVVAAARRTKPGFVKGAQAETPDTPNQA